MEHTLKKLKHLGVHLLNNQQEIMLEILDEYLDFNRTDMLIDELILKLKDSHFSRILLECPKLLLPRLLQTKEKMKVVGERIMYAKDFSVPLNLVTPPFEVWSIHNQRAVSFLSEVMERNIKETASFLNSMKCELPDQVNDMYTVYLKDKEPIGVVFPHIEPDTDQEGRMFWIGMHPNFRGKGYGRDLHLIGLHRLRHDFQAKTYLGATKINNYPMRKIMESNGCELSTTVVSLEYKR